MRFTATLFLLVCATFNLISHVHSDDDCNQENKQKSLYDKTYYEPALDSDPAIEISTSIVATLGDHSQMTSLRKGQGVGTVPYRVTHVVG